jgi:GDPmannose 4,6-dehydratase
LILQQNEPDDFVISTGEQHSVREFVTLAGSHLGYTIEWHGTGVEEQGVDRETGKVLVKIDPRYFRPTEVETLLGDYSKAKAKLGWAPEISFTELVREMVESDLELARRDAHMQQQGFKVLHHHE